MGYPGANSFAGTFAGTGDHYVTVRADYGFQLTDIGDVDHNGRGHVGVNVSY